MYKLVLLFLTFLNPIFSYAQQVKIENGLYWANYKGESINLIVEDGKLFLSVVGGAFKMNKDSIFVVNEDKGKSHFSLNFALDKTVAAGKIKVTISKSQVSSKQFYVGTHSGNSDVNFQSLTKIQETLAESDTSDTPNDNMIFELDKSEFLTFVNEDNYAAKTEISKFKIPENINSIAVNYLNTKTGNMNLSGVYDEKKQEFTLSNNGKTPLVFKLEKNIIAQIAQPVETRFSEKWTYPGKEEAIKVEEVELAKDAQTTEITSETKPEKYVFRHFRSTSFEESMSRMSKTPKKFLVVAFDAKNKQAEGNFTTFLTQSEQNINGYMYDQYNEALDFFDFYWLTDKDKTLLKKYVIKSDSGFFILNSSGDLLYQTDGTLTDRTEYFGVYNNAHAELEKANQQLVFDKIIFDKKATNKAFLDVLGEKYPFGFGTNGSLKFTVATELKDADDAAPMTDEERERLSKEIPPPVVAEERDDNYYGIFKDPKNLYKLKATYDVVYEKWAKLVKNFKDKPKYDKDYVLILKQELYNEGFSKTSFEQTHEGMETVDFDILDYVFANYERINKEQNPENDAVDAAKATVEAVKKTEVKVDAATAAADAAADAVVIDGSYQPYLPNINAILDGYFVRVSNAQNFYPRDKISPKFYAYYKKFFELQPLKTGNIKKYFNALILDMGNSETQKEFFRVFELYLNNILLPNKSLIENLDLDFTANLEYESNWITFKNAFANDCNQAAWEVAKIESNKNLVLKAIKWSEMSLDLQKDTHYYFDTLARLYYLNGQKDKAILTQEKAIVLTDDPELIAEYKTVLAQMKNGTYKMTVEKK